MGRGFAVDITHRSGGRALPKPVAKGHNRLFLAAGYDFNPPIRQIAHITRDAQCQCFIDSRVAKTDALDPAANLAA